MTGRTVEPETVILVEFDQTGLVKVNASPEEMADKSAKAVDQAMYTIKEMAERVTETMQSIAMKPQAVEVAFGLKLNAETGAMIAKAGVEASINVKMTWENS